MVIRPPRRRRRLQDQSGLCLQTGQTESEQWQKDFTVPMAIQDMISSFYYARTLNFKDAKKNQVFEFKCFMDDEIYPLKVKYVGDETISIRKGKFKCMKFVPVVQTGRYFKSENDVNFWVTDDENRIPILVKAKFRWEL